MRFGGLQHLLGAHPIVRHGDGCYDRILPGIEAVDFGNCNIEALAQTILQAFDDVAFVFQGVRVLDVDLQGQDADDGHSYYRNARLTDKELTRNRNFDRNTFHGKRFERIADLDVVEVDQRDTAFEAVLHFAGIILEAL